MCRAVAGYWRFVWLKRGVFLVPRLALRCGPSFNRANGQVHVPGTSLWLLPAYGQGLHVLQAAATSPRHPVGYSSDLSQHLPSSPPISASTIPHNLFSFSAIVESYSYRTNYRKNGRSRSSPLVPQPHRRPLVLSRPRNSRCCSRLVR
jgi:hypothetical protein